MKKALIIVIPNPSLVISSVARNLSVPLRINSGRNLAFLPRAGSVRNLDFSGKDCHVASLLAMKALKELIDVGIN